jgi:uncharacterized protein (DUF952 family)/putative intracellular protease/amidase
MIFHLTTRAAWVAAQVAGRLTAESLTTGGFIHCSTADQIVPVANALYRDVLNTVVLCIDPGLLDVPVQWEAPAHPDPHKALPSDERLRWFPHIYGPVPVHAVTQVVDMPRAADGTYSLPDAIRWQSRRVALFVFEEVEVLDFAGPIEVFSMALSPAGQRLFHVTTFSHDGQPLGARNGLHLLPNVARAHLSQHEILIIPGGPNAAIERELQNAEFIAWLGEQIGRVELLLSVCTGAWMLAKAGVLHDLQATTYHTDYDRLRELDPSVVTCEGQRWADNGKVVTSAGVSAGIDMALYTVQKLFGADIANATARRMEYDYFHAE